MKINKLYTLSQFVDYTNKTILNESKSLELIVRYNEFLKQSLKKEMFENEFFVNTFKAQDLVYSTSIKLTLGELAGLSDGQLELNNIKI